MPSTPPVPPSDGSGGYILLQYSNGSFTHKQRLHVQPFSATDGVYASAGSGEPDIPSTVDHYGALWKNFYSTAWTLSLVSVFQNVGGVITEVYPTFGTTPSSVAGVGSPAPSGDIYQAIQLTYTFRTTVGNHAKIVLLSSDQIGPTLGAASITASSGGVAAEQALVGGVTTSPIRIVGHDGHALLGVAHRTLTFNRRLRRHYGLA